MGLEQKKEQRNEYRSEQKSERTQRKLEVIYGRQEARAENGPRFEAGERREARKEIVNKRQEARAENGPRFEAGERREARKEIVNQRQEKRAENGPKFEAGERREARKEKVSQKQEARAERGPRPEGDRREARLEQLADKQAMKQVARMGRMKQIQLKKTWNPCQNGIVSNDDLGPRKKCHMQRCMIGKNYQNDALRCIVYGLRAEHVDKECQSICDQILASYADLNNDMAECEANKKN